MPELTKERRDALREQTSLFGLDTTVARAGLVVSCGELSALLDMADERDRLREARTLVLDVVAYVDNAIWVAACVQWDILAQGDTQDAAVERLRRTVELEILDRQSLYGRPFSGLDWNGKAARRWEDHPSGRATIEVTL